MKTSDFFYTLPKELIAQTPLKDRASSRLLTLNRTNGAIQHKTFKDISSLLREGDCLVLNDTKVLPARLRGQRETGGLVEITLLERKLGDTWEALAYPGKKAKAGNKIIFSPELSATVEDITPQGNRIVKFCYSGVFEQLLDELGEMPLPPYITQKLNDKSKYQTVYAANQGSAAAPTAGLHFTPQLLSQLSAKNVKIAKITLHVGLGTFRPVRTEDVTNHVMHSERFSVSPQAADTINDTKKSGGRIVAVGTTTVRTLETIASTDGYITPQTGRTDIFIYPPYRFKVADALVTNFHLPESTLLMLVSALAGRENILNAYNAAVQEKYRFFSFGDAMFIY